MKIGEEEAQSDNWKFGKSEGKNKNKGSLKSKAQKLKFSGKPQESHNWIINSIGQNTPVVKKLTAT